VQKEVKQTKPKLSVYIKIFGAELGKIMYIRAITGNAHMKG
jgi:hypothetical protein